jgi:hypothetical protein
MTRLARAVSLLAVFLAPCIVRADEPLHERIDRLILAGAKGKPVSPPSDDAEFLRRVTLDLDGTIPTAAEARAFLDSKSAGKRLERIDALLAGPGYARRMQEAFHVMFMERLGDHLEWEKYLRSSFAANKPWDQMAREILRAAPCHEMTRGASFFLAKRLENYGANPVDYAALARDVGRLFLGKDLRCAQCHDHLFIGEYKQADFQGLFAFVQNAYLVDRAYPTVGERPPGGKIAFVSVFGKKKQETGPRLPGGKEIAIPKLAPAEQYLTKPDPKTRFPGVPRFSPLTELAQMLPAAGNADFSRNIVNRLWWLMMGRGLVHPLDLHHKGNPPAHPELLDLLAREFVDHKFDIKWFLRQLALTQTYQRSSLLPDGETKPQPARFLTALEKRLSAEQMLSAMLEATGEREAIATTAKPAKEKTTALATMRAKFGRAFAGPAREPEEDMPPSLKGALFVLNDPAVLAWLTPHPGNLVDRLARQSDAGKVAAELYLSVLTRRPAAEERDEVAKYLQGKTGKDRAAALGRLAWALLASTEFGVNH